MPVNFIEAWRGNASGMFWDVSAQAPYPIAPIFYGANALYLRPSKSDGTYVDASNLTSATIPFTWTTGDIISVSGTYEIA